jgi:hypothetical protein
MDTLIEVPQPPEGVMRLVQRHDDACVSLDYGKMRIKKEYGISGRGQSLNEATS